MAKNRKKRRQEMEAAGVAPPKPVAKAPKREPPPEPPKGPATQPKKAKVKRPKYVRAPRATPKPKPAATEPVGPKPLTFAAITLTSGIAKSIPKPGIELVDRPGTGLR
jgi:hypothetical protein